MEIRPKQRGSVAISRVVFIPILLMLLLSCVSSPGPVGDAQLETQMASYDQSFAQAGDHVFEVQSGVFETRRGLKLDYQVYKPQNLFSELTIFVAHGFLRSLTTMQGWAQHFASNGYKTVVLSFVNSSIFAGNHDLNAQDLLGLASLLAGKGERIYLGFSAGGLAALVAASQDSLARAYVGLDPVDGSGLASKALARISTQLSTQLLFLWAAPGPCNANNNAKALVDDALARGSQTIGQLSFDLASHAHFEYPYSADAGAFCGNRLSPKGTELMMAAIRSTVTQFILSLATID